METNDNKIWVLDLNSSKLTPFFFYRNNQKIKNVQKSVSLQTGWWYVFYDQTLCLFNEKGEWMIEIVSEIKNAFANYHVELEESVWLATSNGLIKINIKENFFKLIHDNAEFTDFRGITEDESGNIYFINNDVYKWNPLTDVLTQIPNFKGAYDIVYKDSILWTSVYAFGKPVLGHGMDLRTRQKLNYSGSTGKYAYSILETDTEDRYLVGHLGGLSYLELKKQIITPFERYNEFEELKSLDIYHLHKSRSGIWLATSGGIFRMTEREGILQRFDKASGQLPFDYIRHIYEDESGVFWLASLGSGLIRWEAEKSDFSTFKSRQFTIRDGLSNDHLYAVYEDNHDRFWISSDKGLMKMDKHTFEVQTYTTEDGLPHNEFNTTSHYKASDGSLYFGGLGGLITFHPDDIPLDTEYDKPIVFTNCRLLRGRDADLTDLTKSVLESQELVIEPNDKFFEIEFALLDFDNTENHRYAYQIEGYDENWRTIEENFLRINQLPYGDYTLNVKGQNIKKGWSNQELVLKIRVLKPSYLQSWFLISSFLILVILVFALIKRREINLKKDRERLEKEVKKRTQTIRQQTEELKALDKAKTRFFSNITHEFRTPLTLIIGPLEQVIENQPPPKIFKRRMNGVLNNAKHLLNLINQMLDLSKLESGRMSTEVTKGDIVNYSRELAARFEPMIEKKGLRFRFVSNMETWETHFDKDKWDKIIYNLLSNALKFTPKDKIIQMSLMKTVHKDRETIRLDVKDTGLGIKKEQLDKIFNRFFQEDDSSKRTQGGTGIGLALVKELVELQGGEIRVSSRVNHGTTFEIYLPVLNYEKVKILQALEVPEFSIPTSVIEKTSEPTPVPKLEKEGKLELLIIEDNEEIREYIQYCLDTSKYNITEAVNGEEGVLKGLATIPDLIISDVMMPRKNGFEVVEEVRRNLATSHVPIILLTAKASMESRLEGLNRGADAYLTKPFSPQELALRIEKLIEVRQLLQQRYQSNSSIHLPINSGETYQKEDKFITELKAYILKNIDQPNLTGDAIGRQFGMSRVHLYRKLKALTNSSVTEFVKKNRLERARELILEGELNISEITYKTGFSSVSYFSRTFKKEFGVTPSEL